MYIKTKIKLYLLKLLLLYSAAAVMSAVLTPVFAHFGEYSFSAKLSFILSDMCHQNPLRSFHLFGYPLGLCARCLGVYTGFAAGAILKYKIKNVYLIWAAVIAITDIILNSIIKYDTTNTVRFIAGILTGLLIVSLIKKEIRNEKDYCIDNADSTDNAYKHSCNNVRRIGNGRNII